MIVRRAIAADCEGVVQCARFYELTPTDDDCVAHLFHLALACDGMFVALDNDQVVGFLCAAVLPHPFNAKPYVDVIAIFVQPSHRGTWAALGLMRKMLAWVSTTPLDMVKIAAPLASRMSGVVERLGFHAVETVFIKDK